LFVNEFTANGRVIHSVCVYLKRFVLQIHDKPSKYRGQKQRVTELSIGEARQRGVNKSRVFMFNLLFYRLFADIESIETSMAKRSEFYW
jgi:hypothetical protein